MNYLAPKKSLGQNFLTSIPARLAIVDGGEVYPGEHILEIGPGKGFLTEELLKRGCRVTALEKDRELIPYLTEKFNEETKKGDLRVIEGDALTFEPESHNLTAASYKLIANIPYYITGAILSRYLSHTHQPSTIVVLIQKEVAVRACATDGKESLLSLSIKVYGEPKLIYRVSRGSFFPIPTVDSAVLQIKNISRKHFKSEYHEALFFKLIHAGFQHKRKFALSNIQAVFPDQNIHELFGELQISPKVRAEQLPPTLWLSLAEKIATNPHAQY